MAGAIAESPGGRTRAKEAASELIHPGLTGARGVQSVTAERTTYVSRCQAFWSLSHIKCPETPWAGADRATQRSE